jgi:hypothetical protein
VDLLVLVQAAGRGEALAAHVALVLAAVGHVDVSSPARRKSLSRLKKAALKKRLRDFRM